MNSRIYTILLELENRFPMEINAPASLSVLEDLKKRLPELPKSVLEMLSVTNGVEINVPGTVLYSAEELLANNKEAIDEYAIGYMSFGDELYINSSGVITQIDHETKEMFLDWESLEDYLVEELNALD